MGDNLVLKMERRFSASLDAVFDAWTQPDLLAKWFGPENTSVPDCAMDLTVGGHWHAVLHGENGAKHHCSGVYKVIERPTLLVFTWAWTQEDGSRGYESIITVSLKANGNGTDLSFEQVGFVDAEAQTSHESGWTDCFNCLEKLLS